jgi:GH15 family glucan-1,4-alpha-glucosidase
MTETASLELGVIGNCQVAALVDAEARIVWCCLPRPDGDPVFSALLRPTGGLDAARAGSGATDDTAGVFAIDLCDLAEASHEYVRNTAVLVTTLRDRQGNALRVTDFCPRFRSRGRMFRPMMLVRLVEPIAGRPVARIRIEPTANYGASRPQRRSGSHHLSFASDDLAWRITTETSLSSILEGRPEVIGRPQAFLLGPDESVAEAPLSLARHWLEETGEYWRDWVRTLAIPFEWQDAVIRAAISLKLCTYEDTGAVLAALTTSIPEARDSGRNWDYRYCWLRDAYFVVQALNRLGTTRTMEHLLHFLDHTVARSDEVALQPLYGIGGGAEVPERIVESLAGYPRHGPGARRQRGLWPAGAARRLRRGDPRLDADVLRPPPDEPGDPAAFARLEKIGERAIEVFAQPDAGPWEFRGHLAGAHLLVADVLGGLRPARAHRRPPRPARASRLVARSRRADARGTAGARVERESRTLQLRARWRRRPRRDAAAAARVRPRRGHRPALPRDARRRAARARARPLADALHPRGRFRRPETAFTICGFWHVLALHAAGRLDEARELFEQHARVAHEARPAVGGHRPGDRRAVGQLPADLQPGRHHPVRDPPQPALGGCALSRVVAVSNRVSLPRRGAAPGGLAVGVLAAMQARGGLWFGWSGQVAHRESDEPDASPATASRSRPIDLRSEEFARYVNGFSNGALWPTFHYFLETVRFSDVDYAGYEVNRLFARTLLPLLEPDDLIWVHDFHLIPLARMLRDLGATQPIAFFLHVPFPTSRRCGCCRSTASWSTRC